MGFLTNYSTNVRSFTLGEMKTQRYEVLLKGLAALVGLLLVVVTTFTGYVVTISKLSLSILGIVLLIRGVAQLIFANLHNRRYRNDVRQPLLEAIIHITGDESVTKKVGMDYLQWRKYLAKKLPNLEWQEVVSALIELHPGFVTDVPLEVSSPIHGIETWEELLEALEALKAQTWSPKRVHLVLNDPDDVVIRHELPLWKAQQDNPEFWNFIIIPVADKRAAMTAALRQEESVIALNMDSDTIAHEDAVLLSALTFYVYPDVHGITSNVRIKNLHENEPWWNHMLEWETYFRYDYVNNVERAARSWFWNEIVMSGPWMGIRRESWLTFLVPWLEQTFLGSKVRPGDDRKATYYLNWMKKKVIYCPDIFVWTDCPETLARWLGQQSRWTFSMYVNFVDSVRENQIWSLHPWSILDQIYMVFFTYLLIGSVTRIVWEAILIGVTGDLSGAILRLAPYAIIIVSVNLFRGIYAAITNQDIKGLLMAIYIRRVIQYLIPIRIKRMFNMIDPGWAGRRDAKKQS